MDLLTAGGCEKQKGSRIIPGFLPWATEGMVYHLAQEGWVWERSVQREAPVGRPPGDAPALAPSEPEPHV